VLQLLAGGQTESEILAEYPDLQPEGIRECLRFAAASAKERELPFLFRREISDRQCRAINVEWVGDGRDIPGPRR